MTDKKPIWLLVLLQLTGHSLGGSMSAIAAHEIAANSLFDDCQIITVTFGEPRTGDMAFAVSHNKLVGLNRNMLTKTLSLLYARVVRSGL